MITRLIALAVLPILCSAALAQDVRSLNGEVTYRERAALSPDAVLIIEVTGIDRSMISDARVPTEGRQVPIPFEIEVPGNAEGTLRAGLSTGGRVDWLGEPVEIDTGMSGDIGALTLTRFQPMGFTSTFRCAEQVIRVGFSGENAILDTGSERLILAPSRAASGARYEAEGDPGTWFWNQGDSALVSLGGEELPECSLSLPVDETPYSASGNEPFWSMTIDAGQMTLLRLGMDDLTMPVTETGLTEVGDILVIAADTERALRAVIVRKPMLCRDSMTGMPHPETVELSMGDNTIRGCGGNPWSLLVGQTWVVEDIGGAGVIDTARATMGFVEAGRVYGSGSCNRYFGPVTLTGETLTFGAMASTNMACPEALMTQERRFFETLGEVSGFDIDDTGALILLASDGRVVTARAATDGSAP